MKFKEIVQINYSYTYGFYIYSLLRGKIVWKSYRYASEFKNKEQAHNEIMKQYNKMNKGKRYICTKEFRRITVGTVVYIQEIGVGHYANSYTITPEDSQKSRITNNTTIKEYFKEEK